MGANYSFTDFMSAYVRVNRGGHFLDFDNGIRGSTTGNTPPMQVIRNYEGGFKFENELFYADISAYFRDFTGLLYQPTDATGAAGRRSDTLWLRIEGRQFHRRDHARRKFPLPGGRQLSGRRVHGLRRLCPLQQRCDRQRLRADRRTAAAAPAQVALHADAQLPLPDRLGDIKAYVTYTHVGDHTQDQSGLQQLGTYETWDFGITANVGENWQFSLRGTNVSDELGLTESNSRIFGVAADAGGVLLARPLEGREISFQAKYLW